MAIKDREQLLFAEWKEKRQYDYFVSDGVFDEDELNRQKYRLLFVLKEANWENASVDLCEFLLSEKSSEYWKTWNNVARWTKAILDGGDYPQYISKPDKTYWLRKIVAMNLKKVGGDERAEDETIYSYAQNDRFFIKRQIELYDPDIIVCCGRGVGKNADILHDVIFDKKDVSEWQEPIIQYNYFLAKINSKENVPVISFYHPQIRGSHQLLEKRYEEIKYIAEHLKERYL